MPSSIAGPHRVRLSCSAPLAMVLRPTSLPASEEGGCTLPSRRAPVFLDPCSRALHGSGHSPPRGLTPSTSPSVTPSVARCSATRFFHGFVSPPRPVPATATYSFEWASIPLRLSWSHSPERATHAAPASVWRTSLLPAHRGERSSLLGVLYVKERGLDRLPREPVRLFSVVQPVVPNVVMDICRTRANMEPTAEPPFSRHP